MNRCIVEKAGRVQHPSGVLLSGSVLKELDSATQSELQEMVGHQVQIRPPALAPFVAEVTKWERSRGIGGDLCIMVQLGPEATWEHLGPDGPWGIWTVD